MKVVSHRYKGSLLLALALFSLMGLAQGNQPSFRATVNRTSLSLGEYFQYTLTMANVEGGKIERPSFENFQVLQGPSTSQSVQIINGRKSVEYSESWLLKPLKEGSLNIPPVKLKTATGWLESNAVTINVSKGGGGNSNVQTPVQGSGDFIVSVELNKRKVYVGEQILASYKIYSRFQDLRFESIEYASIDGFWTETIEEEVIEWEPQLAVINGIQYRVAVLKREILFPQRSGQLTVGSTRIKALGKNSFFGRYNQLNAASKTVSVEVMPLPEPKPAGFVGTFEQLSCVAETDRNELNANEAINFTVKLSGKGNLKMLDALPFSFPPDVELFDPKRTDKINVSAAGMSGSRQFDYVLIPRTAGVYNIPSLELSYFDPNQKKYLFVEVPEFGFNVGKGQGTAAGNYTYNSKTDVNVLASDLRYIETEPALIHASNKSFIRTPLFYGVFAFPFVLLAGVFFVARRKEERSRDPLGWKMKKAGREARKKLAMAASLKSKGKSAEFAGELIKVLHGYLSDRFAIPISSLNDRGIRARLEGRMNESSLQAMLDVLKQCEFLRYAPAGGTDETEIYDKVSQVIAQLEAVEV